MTSNVLWVVDTIPWTYRLRVNTLGATMEPSDPGWVIVQVWGAQEGVAFGCVLTHMVTISGLA